jgi:hypothetical protein
MSVQQSRDRWYARLLPTMPQPITTPLSIIGLALLGPVGWITAAVVLPLATLATILWLGRARPGDGERPE